MSADHYTIRSTTSVAIKKGLLKIKLPKNDANQYSHNAVVLVGNQLRRLLTGIYNSGADGPGMSKLMDSGDNALTLRKNTDTHTIESVLTAAKATAKKKGNDKDGKPTPPLITSRDDAEVEAARENLLTQAIMGAKEGITDGITALVGSDITDAILRSADGTDFKGVDEYSLAELFEAALEGADRPGASEILDQLVESITLQFDFRKKCSANVELLRSKAAKMATFGIKITEPIIASVIIANVDAAAQEEYGVDFRQSLQAIRRQYNYNHVHDAASLAVIMKELASADGARNLRDAPNANALSNSGKAHAVNTAVSKQMTKLCDEASSVASSSYAYSTMSDEATISDSDTSADTKFRRYRRAERKHEEKQYQRKKQDKPENAAGKKKKKDKEKPINKDCRHCVKFNRRTAHPLYSEGQCFFNKKYNEWRPRWACRIMDVEYHQHPNKASSDDSE